MIPYAEIEKIEGWMGPWECCWLAGLASTMRSWTDVGVYHGRSSIAVATSLPKGATLNLVDIAFPEAFQTQWLPKVRKLRPDLVIATFPIASVDAALVVPDSDVVFIDGDHKYESVKADILAWQGKCRVLCGHDYQPHWIGVMRAVDELCPGAIQPTPDLWMRAL